MADGRTVLIVDDDPDIVEALTLVLEGAGHATLSAANADDALTMAIERRPDVILLDVMMPEGTEGFHTVWNLRSHEDPQIADIPVIVLSAIHSTTPLRLYPDQKDSSYGPGEFLPVQGFLDKPIQPKAMLDAIDRVLAAATKA